MHETFVQEATSELRDVTARIVELEEQMRSARDVLQRKVVRAPVAGRVLDLRVTTAGGSIGPRDPILDIVPDDNPLLIEARITVDAIAELHVGARTDVRLTAYRQRTTPLIEGKVIYVSPDAMADRQTGASYFLMHVELDRASLAKAGAVAIQPGMGAEVFVRTHDRTAIEFLLEPLLNAARRSLREH
jgi:HlyD family type I secretion membrane fusion protein